MKQGSALYKTVKNIVFAKIGFCNFSKKKKKKKKTRALSWQLKRNYPSKSYYQQTKEKHDYWFILHGFLALKILDPVLTHNYANLIKENICPSTAKKSFLGIF